MTFPLHGRRAGLTQIVINDHDVFLRPTQGHGAAPYRVLTLGTLGIFEHLAQRRLANVKISATLEMLGRDFGFGIHGVSPGWICCQVICASTNVSCSCQSAAADSEGGGVARRGWQARRLGSTAPHHPAGDPLTAQEMQPQRRGDQRVACVQNMLAQRFVTRLPEFGWQSAVHGLVRRPLFALDFKAFSRVRRCSLILNRWPSRRVSSAGLNPGSVCRKSCR